MADVPDMTDVPPQDSEQPSSGHDGPDRRRTIDLVRVERGEPERRRLPYRTDATDRRRAADEPPATGSGPADSE